MLGRFRILGTIGKGGMGIVFKGFHLNLERDVAIKTMRIDKINSPDVVDRFRQEIKLIGRMDHENVVRATDAGEKNGIFYLVMEFLPGVDLQKLVTRNGPLPCADACELIRQAAMGLAYIHQTLVHRDIKPSNLMLTTTGQVKILDLGLAHCDGEDGDNAHDTPAGMVLGTRFYMAPEQARGSRTIDGRADIYSLGCTLFKLLTGKEPFSGAEFSNSASQIYAHCHVPLTSVSAFESIPDELRPILLRMMAKDRDERYQTAREVADALAPFTAGSAPVQLGAAGIGEPKVHPLALPLPDELGQLTQSVVETPRDTPTVSTVAYSPTRWWQRRTSWIGLGGGLMAMVVVVLLFQRQPPDDGLTSLDNSPLHSLDHLLKRRPIPIGFDISDPRSGFWSRDAERLDVPGPKDHYYLLGSTQSHDFDFEAVIEQSPWSGYVGMFWGYQEDRGIKNARTANVAFAKFQCIHIVRPPNSIGGVSQRNQGTLHFSTPGHVASRLVPPTYNHKISALAGKIRLRLEVTANRLSLVEINGERMDGVYSADSKANLAFENNSNQGGIGLLTLGNASTFSDVRFVLRSKNDNK